MPSYLTSPKIAQVSLAGPILPMSFVTNDPNQNFTCRQATATTDFPTGVAQVGSDVAPGLQNALFPNTTPTTQYAGQPGAQIAICGVGDVCPIRLGNAASTGVNNGTFLTNDSTGLAVPLAQFTSSRYQGGIAVQSGTSQEIIELYVLPGKS